MDIQLNKDNNMSNIDEAIQEKSLSSRISGTVSKCVAHSFDTHTATDTDVIVLVNAMAMSMADHVKHGSNDELFAKSARYYINRIEALYADTNDRLGRLEGRK